MGRGVHGGRRRRGLAGAALALILAGLGSTAAPAVGTAQATDRPGRHPADAPTENQVTKAPEITLDSMTPGTLRPGEDLRVTATLTAGTEPVASGSRMELCLRPGALRTRYSVTAWSTANPADQLGTRLVTAPITVQVPAGASRKVTLSVPADNVPLPDRAAEFGPRAVAVALTDPGSNRKAVNHTFLVWYPRQTAVRRVGMSVIVPMTAGRPAPTTGLPSTARLQTDTQPGGRLDSLLSAAARPGVTLAVDPSLLVSADPDTSASVSAWRSRLVRQSRTNQTLLLPSADPDVAAVAHAGAGQLLTTALARAKTQGDSLAGAGSTVSLPADGRLDESTAGLLQRNGYTCAVLRSAAQPTFAELPVTPSGRSRISFPDGRVAPMCGLLADDTITDVLAGPTETDPDAPTGQAAVQRLLAESAAVAEQNPSASRQLLAVAPRRWNPGGTGRAQLNALLGQPWVSAARLSSLVSRDVPNVQRETPTIEPQQQAAELDPSGITGVTDQLKVVEQASGAATTGRETITDSMEQPAIGMVSQAWRDDPTAWTAAQAAFSDTVKGVRRAVHVVPGSSINQVSRDVRLPVTVQNDFDQPVEVRLHAAPSTNLLRVVNGDVTVRVPKQSRAVSYVSVEGVGSGDAEVKLTVQTPQGFVLDDADAIRVRVRADWENRATYVAGGVFLVILVAGIVRTLRRGRTRADTIDPTTGESST